MTDKSILTAALANVAAAVVAAGSQSDLVGGTKLFVDGVDMSMYLDFRQKLDRSRTWAQKPLPGQYYISIGDYGQKKVLGVKADGAINATLAAETMISLARSVNARRAARSTQENNKEIAEALVVAIGAKPYGPVSLRPSEYEATPVQVRFSLDRAMTVAKAEAFYRAIAALDLA